MSGVYWAPEGYQRVLLDAIWGDAAYTCLTCGALVARPGLETHTAWHSKP